jgi:hypothetical protein
MKAGKYLVICNIMAQQAVIIGILRGAIANVLNLYSKYTL